MPSCSKFAYDVLARIKKPLARVFRTFTCFSIKILKLDLNTFIPNKAYISNLSILNGVPVVYFKDQIFRLNTDRHRCQAKQAESK